MVCWYVNTEKFFLYINNNKSNNDKNSNHFINSFVFYLTFLDMKDELA